MGIHQVLEVDVGVFDTEPLLAVAEDLIDVAQARTETQIIGNHDGRVEGLEIQHHDGIHDQHLGWFNHQWYALQDLLLAYLLSRGRQQHKIVLLRDTAHHRLNLELGASRSHGLKLTTIQLGYLAPTRHQVHLDSHLACQQTPTEDVPDGASS